MTFDESLESPLSLSDDDLFRFLDLRVSFLLFFFFSFLLLLFFDFLAIALASSRFSARIRRMASFSDSAAVFAIALSSLHGPKISGTSRDASPRHSSPKSSVLTPALVRNV